MSDVNSTVITPVKTNPLEPTFLAPTAGQNVDAEDIHLVTQKLSDGLHRASCYVVAAISGLSALTGLLDGEKIMVLDSGQYVYRSAATDTVNSPWVVNGPSGIGRFLHVVYMRSLTQPVNGFIATADSLGFLATPFKNQVEEVQASHDDTGLFSTSSTSWVDVGTCTFVGTTASASDRIEMAISARVAATVGISVDTRLVITLGGVDTPIYESYWSASDTWNMYSFFHHFAPHLAGTILVKFQAKCSAAGTISVATHSLTAKLIRNAA